MLLELTLPPGAYRMGTNYQSAGRYYDVNRVRWIGAALRPIGGWRLKTTDTLAGMARAMIAWRDNSKVSWAAVGTHSKLYIIDSGGDPYDATPSGFTSGRADSITEAGYGSGLYGEGLYGLPPPDGGEIQEASVWTLDTRGEDLVGCMPEDGKIYAWDTSVGTGTVADDVVNAPTADAVFVTNEGAIVALAVDGDSRRIAWSDWDDPTDWSPTALNNAGDVNLQTYGALRCGRRIRGGNLVWTDLDCWLMTPTFNDLVYGFEKLGTACGTISRQAAVAIDEKAVWMAQDGFWLFNGGVTPLPCEVEDYVFSDISLLQGAKVYAVRNTQFSEVWWFYPSGGSNENDRYVAWNYETGVWSFGDLARTCATDKGVFQYPLMIDPNGGVWEHEVGHTYDDSVMPHAEGGPVELGAGDTVMRVTKLIPDEAASGDVEVSFGARFQPNGAISVAGPYILTPKTDVRFSARQVSVRYEGARPVDWRVGRMRIDAAPGGFR